MQNNPTVDVLMAVYNGEKYIRQQVKSILEQTYPYIRIIIRDNCSEDCTKAIIQELIAQHPKQIALLASTTNVGVIGNFSTLLQHATADYIFFSDHDDVWLPHKVAVTMEQMLHLEQLYGRKTPCLAHTDLKVVNGRLELIHPSFWRYSNLNPLHEPTLSRQLVQNQITGCTVAINRSLADLANPIPLNVVMHDWWLGLVAAAFGKIGAVNEATMLYRQHGNNDTGAKRYGLLPFIKMFFNKTQRQKTNRTQLMKIRQAEELLIHSPSMLQEKHRNILQGFLQFNQASFLKRIYVMRKHGFYKTGLLRNLWQLWNPGQRS